jgi:DNA-binding CsgD family transcriptional regulator/tetratricopeptide (TPR) repeat protein
MGGRVASPTLVGRVEELGVLEAARGRAADGEPAVVLVGGEAGVGKTRLVAELADQCRARGARVLAGGCLPAGGDGLPYAPIVEALRPLPGELGVGAVRGLIGPSWSEVARLLPALGEPAGGPAGQSAQARLFEVLLGLFGRLGEQAPAMLVVEDLHWADRSTRQLLAFLARNLRRERLLVVVTYRSDEPRADRLGPYLADLDRGRGGRVERLELARLDRAATAAQLTGILGASPAADLVEAVFVRSEGNPFFTEEVLAAVRAGSGGLPVTTRDLLRGRVQGLAEQARWVLGVAAVAGRQVSHRLLAAVAGLDDRQLDGALRAAVAGQVLVTRSGGDGYRFRHALLWEVVEAGLLPGERARLHAGYAHALSERPELAAASPAAAAAELAAHWDAAGEPGRALPARVQAGLAAERARAFAEAHRHYQRALTLWEQVADPGRPAGLDRVELLVRAAEAVASAGAVERAVGLLQDALGRVDPVAEPVRAAVLLTRLGDHRGTARDEPGALAAFEEAERLLAGAPPSAEHARVLASHALRLTLGLQSPKAVPYCEEAIRIARAVGARAEEAHALSTLGYCLDDLNQLDRAIALQLEARRIAEEVGDAETVIRTYTTRSYSLAAAGRDREALDDAHEGYQRARQLGLERAVGSYVADYLAWCLLVGGRWEECEQLTREVLAGDIWAARGLHATRGLLLARQGDFATAREQLRLALRLSLPSRREDAWLGLAELGLWAGRDDDAETAVAEGLGWYAEVDPERILPQVIIPWYVLALRLAADRAERAAARRAPEEVAEARRRAAPVAAEVNRLAAAREPQATRPSVTGSLLLAQAELSRLEGRSDLERWVAAAAACDRLQRPFEAAYARFRHAEALLAGGAARAQAEQALRSAHQTAVALDAGPLRRQVELLAQRGRLRLDDHVGAAAVAEAPPSPSASLGLTRREAEVLALVAAGRTNRQIGTELFITEGTASVHVSRILAKLGVAGRGEAAAIAHRLGLDTRLGQEASEFRDAGADGSPSGSWSMPDGPTGPG